MSLAQAKKSAIATYASGSVPDEYYSRHKEKTFVIAYDNDKAGQTGTAKTIACFKSLGINYQVAFPPEGSDWNDLLINGDLQETRIDATLEMALWRGQLFEASTAAAYFELYSKYCYTRIFEYRNALYTGWFKTVKETDANDKTTTAVRVPKAMQLVDCALRLRYSIVDDGLEYNFQTTNIIEIESPHGKPSLSEFTAKEMSSPAAFREKLAHYRQTSTCTQENLNLVSQYLFSQPAPTVRKLQSLGYDKKSGCFVFSHFLYDKNGNRHALNKDGFFDRQKIMPFTDELCISRITEASTGDLKKTAIAIEEAFGKNGLIALGFYISTAFSHVIFKKYGSFPILNLYHAKDTGKSTLTNLLNQTFMVDWSGISISGGNTKKGELRKLSQKSSLVTPLSEWRLNSPKNIFDPSSILNAYNRLPLEIRAKKTNGNETVEIPFDGALCFVQNDYPFVTEPEQERVIDLRFEDGSLNITSDGFKTLITSDPQKMAGVGDFIFKNRQFFEDNIIAAIDRAKDRLTANGIKNRIAINHATAFAGVQLLVQLIKAKEISMENLYLEIEKTALHKVRHTANQLDIADHFFSIADRLRNGTGGVDRSDTSVYINMPAVFLHIKEECNDTLNKDTLFTQLRSHARFIKASYNKQIEYAGDKKIMRVWEFRLPKDPVESAEEKDPPPLDYANLFLEAIEYLTTFDGVVKGGAGDDHIYVSMYECMGHLRHERKMRIDEPKLMAELRKHPRFVKSDFRDKTNPLLKNPCWIFEKPAI